jgi:hypothetical protein
MTGALETIEDSVVIHRIGGGSVDNLAIKSRKKLYSRREFRHCTVGVRLTRLKRCAASSPAWLREEEPW